MQKTLLLAALISTVSSVHSHELCSVPMLDQNILDVANATCLFSKPLIVGASISAGYLNEPSEGPSHAISKKLNSAAEITKRAFPDNPSVSVIPRIDKPSPLPTPSIVMGLDLFFWDAESGCGENFTAIADGFFKKYQDLNVPMIIGKIPVGGEMPAGIRAAGQSPCTKVINEYLDQKCTLDKNCILYDSKPCFKKIYSLIDQEKKNATEEEKKEEDWEDKIRKKYFHDKYHPTLLTNDICSTEYIATKEYQKLTCPTPTK